MSVWKFIKNGKIIVTNATKKNNKKSKSHYCQWQQVISKNSELFVASKGNCWNKVKFVKKKDEELQEVHEIAEEYPGP